MLVLSTFPPQLGPAVQSLMISVGTQQILMSSKKMHSKNQSIAQTLQLVDALHQRSLRISYLLGYRSRDISKNFRKTIASCNSVAIIFLQFDMFPEALHVLRQAVQTDVHMFFEGGIPDRKWQGRALTYCNLGYLFYRCAAYESSLKFLNDADSLIAQTGGPIDLSIGRAFISSLASLRLKRWSEAERWIDVAFQYFGKVSKQERSTRMSHEGCGNLFCLLTLASQVMRTGTYGDYDQVALICAEVIKGEPDHSPGAKIIRTFLQNPSYQWGLKVICGQEFHSLMFIACFFPLISPSTPVIKSSQLRKAQEKAAKDGLINLNGLLGSRGEDGYTLIMRESLANVRLGKQRLQPIGVIDLLSGGGQKLPNTRNQLQMDLGNRSHYRDIFQLFAKNGKITRDKLVDMFAMVQLNPSPQDLEKYLELVFENGPLANFDDFLKLFKMKCSSSQFSKDEILKSFILISDRDRRLHYSRVEALLREYIENQKELWVLMDHVKHFTDDQGFVDYALFVERSFQLSLVFI